MSQAEQVRTTEVTYSADGTLYYISGWLDDLRPTFWASVTPIPKVEDKDKYEGIFKPNLALYDYLKDGQQVAYYREHYPFTFFKVKSGISESVGTDSDLFLDYASSAAYYKR